MDEKGCADGDPRWEVVPKGMATGRWYHKAFLATQVANNGFGLSLRILVDKSSMYSQEYIAVSLVSETARKIRLNAN